MALLTTERQGRGDVPSMDVILENDTCEAAEKDCNSIDTQTTAATSSSGSTPEATTMDSSRDEQVNLPTSPQETEITGIDRRSSLIRSGRSHSEPDVLSHDDSESDYDSSDDEDEEEQHGGSLLSRVGTSMRNIFASSDNTTPALPRTVAGRPSLQRRYQSERIIRQGSTNSTSSKTKLPPLETINNKKESRGFFDFNEDHNDGVVTYLGRQYSARDLLQRCESSAGSQHSRRSRNTNNESFASLLSFEEDSDEDDDSDSDEDDSTHSDDEDEACDEGILGQFLGRSFTSFSNHSNRGRGGGKESSGQRQQQRLARSMSHDAFSNKYNNRGRRAMSPPRKQLSFTWRPRSRSPQPPPPPPPKKSPRDHLGTLQVAMDDVLKITENPKDFAALKQTLKKNRAVTNGLLQQGFHVFVHQQKQQQEQLEQRKRQLLLQQQSSQRITRPATKTGNPQMGGRNPQSPSALSA